MKWVWIVLGILVVFYVAVLMQHTTSEDLITPIHVGADNGR